MRDFLIAALVLGGGFGVLWLVLQKSGTDKWERSRVRSEAAASVAAHQPLANPADQDWADEIHDMVLEKRAEETGELPVVPAAPAINRRHVYKDPSPQQVDRMRQRMLAPVRRFEADPLTAPIPDLHHVAPPVEFTAVAIHWFTQPAIEAARYPALPAEPEPLPALDFTGSWTGSARRELRALLDAEAKVEASR